jgi:hypothetical protein
LKYWIKSQFDNTMNHDVSSGHAIREIIRQTFKDNPRVIIDDSPAPIKYQTFGKNLFGFAHGDYLKLANAGEVMAADCQSIWSDTTHRYFHFGHYHVDSVKDSRLCKVESHRNLAPLNEWAFASGYRTSGTGTMKAITYHKQGGEVARNIYNVPYKAPETHEQNT